MIHYALSCASGHEFDGWFRNSSDFEGQAERGLVVCPICGASEVRKRLMAPAVSKGTGGTSAVKGMPADTVPDPKDGAPAPAATLSGVDPKIMEKLRALKREIVSKADYVGSDFAEEARKIHYGEAEERGIYGEASRESVRELTDEGIPVLPLPALPEENN
ncbi:DUF1178 family protein [Stappia sp. GBMRC 2046]|uniref:DUF1178 family protein n=1 Tax=Stappia sediminis TaxID=2692190 RepID=A0A7X3S7V4_9HYPH|nr:DUF1178 family protein [Stappia sediminis]MXN65188.1 DUF1178 family protein [Stappia sediminis]